MEQDSRSQMEEIVCCRLLREESEGGPDAEAACTRLMMLAALVDYGGGKGITFENSSDWLDKYRKARMSAKESTFPESQFVRSFLTNLNENGQLLETMSDDELHRSFLDFKGAFRKLIRGAAEVVAYCPAPLLLELRDLLIGRASASLNVDPFLYSWLECKEGSWKIQEHYHNYLSSAFTFVGGRGVSRVLSKIGLLRQSTERL